MCDEHCFPSACYGERCDEKNFDYSTVYLCLYSTGMYCMCVVVRECNFGDKTKVTHVYHVKVPRFKLLSDRLLVGSNE